MLFKIVKYIFYMLFMYTKGLNLFVIKLFCGKESSLEYTFKLYKKWSKFTIDVLGINIEVEGEEHIPEEPCVFVANHTSMLDIPILVTCINSKIGFISKKEVLKYPIIGFWLKKGKNVALDRNNVRQGIQAINEGIDNIKEGYSMVIFPEGTRSKTDELLPFKKGSLKLATKSKSKVVPVHIDRASRFLEKNKKLIGGNIKITFFEPIDTNKLSKLEEKELTENIRNIIAKVH